MALEHELAKLKDLEAEKEQLLADLEVCKRRISELKPKHEAERWFRHTHPEDYRSMEELNLWCGNINSRLYWVKKDIAIALENVQYYQQGSAVKKNEPICNVVAPSQKSTTDQLYELVSLANRAGLYDAADFLTDFLKRQEVKWEKKDPTKISNQEIIEKFRKQVSERGPLYDGSHLPGEASHYYELDAEFVEGVLKVLDSRD